MKHLVTIALLLLVAHAAPAQGVVDLPDNVASSGNDGVGGIERQPPGAGNLPQPGTPTGPAPDAGPELQPPTRTTSPSNDALAARDLGRALPGRLGAPRAEPIAGADGRPRALLLSGVPAGARVTLVLGLSLVDAPLAGGLLAPAPDLVIGPLVAGADGSLVLPAPWPPGLLEVAPLVAQFWVVDASGPEGLTASNALLLGS